MRSISAGSRPVSAAASSSVYAAVDRREQVLDVAEGEPAGLAGAADLLQRVAALAQARDDAGVGGGGRRPAAVVLRDHALVAPTAAASRA